MNDKKKLRDIVDAIEAIEAYSVSSYDEFLADDKTQDAILYNLITCVSMILDLKNRIR